MTRKRIMWLLAGSAVTITVCSVYIKLSIYKSDAPRAITATLASPKLQSTLLVLKEWKPKSKSQGQNLAFSGNMRRVTKDPAVAEFLGSYISQEIGQVNALDQDEQSLMLNGSVKFEARHIGPRSISLDGTLFIEAVTGNHVPIKHAEAGKNGKLVSSIREIWHIAPDDVGKKVSTTNIDSTNPVVSPDGKFLAYTGRKIDRNGFPGVQRLYILNLSSNELSAFRENDDVDNYTVRAIDWQDDVKSFRVIEDWGESGGNMRFRRADVK